MDLVGFAHYVSFNYYVFAFERFNYTLHFTRMSEILIAAILSAFFIFHDFYTLLMGEMSIIRVCPTCSAQKVLQTQSFTKLHDDEWYFDRLFTVHYFILHLQ